MKLTPVSPAVTDWPALFARLDRTLCFPVAPSRVTTGPNWLFRDMVLDLSDILAQVANASVRPSVVQVYADVVQLPAGTAATISGFTLLVFARLLRTDGAATVVLDTRQGRRARLTLYNGVIEGSLSLVAQTDQGEQTFPLPSAGALGLVVSGVPNGAPSTVALTGIDAWMQTPETPCQLTIAQTFANASALLTDQPGVAADMLTWVRDVEAPAIGLAGQALQAVSLLVLAARGKDGARYVSALNKDVYVDQSKAFMAAAGAIDAAYQSAADTNRALEDRKAAARLMLGHESDTAAFNGAMIEQATNNLNAARLSVATAEMTFAFQRDACARAANRLNAGIAAYEYEHKVQAAFEIIGAIVEFAGAIAEVSMGDEAAAPEAAEAAAKAAKTADSIAEIMKAMSTIAKVLAKVYALADKLAEVGSDLDQLNKDRADYEDVVSTSVPSDDFANAAAQWGAFALSADAQLQPAIAAGVDGANEYLAALKTLALYGTAYLNAQLAVATAAQDVVRLNLQAQIAANDVGRINTYIDGLSAEESENAALMSLLFGRLLNVRRSLIIAIENYRAAYAYWSLQDSSVATLITDPVTKLQTELSQVTAEYGAALARFAPPPAPWNQDVVLKDPALLSTFKTDGTATCTIGLADTQLTGLDRVRVNTVRVTLDGVKVPADQRLAFGITTSGQYQDRLRPETFSFGGAALQRSYIYVPSTDHIIIDGAVANDVQYAYFQPSAFTQWTISLSKADAVDLSTLTAIRLTFLGSAIAHVQAAQSA